MAGMPAHNHSIRYATGFSTSDIAIVDDLRKRVLLITKKKFGSLWAFPGGFLDPVKDLTDEDTARRERGEEILDIRTGNYLQLGPRVWVDDPRLRGTQDKIYTTFFVTPYLEGIPKPGDDAEKVQWFKHSELPSVLVPWHRQALLPKLEAYWEKLGTAWSQNAP